MFKGINSQDGSEIIILDSVWAEQIAELRALDRKNQIVCQGCHQPIRVRAGAIKQRHFAHKHLKDCSYGHDSPLLLQLRALLYKRLVAEYGSCVTLEKQLSDASFPRPIDCWIQRDDCSIAYWIVDSNLRPQTRDMIFQSFQELGVKVHWILASSMMIRHEENPNVLHTTTTEREMMVTTKFDTEVKGEHFSRERTLRFLDPVSEELTTFRSLRLVHEPQMYMGRVYCHPLDQVLVAKRTGDLAHPGERERLNELRAEKARIDKETAQREEEERLKNERRKANIASINWGALPTPRITPPEAINVFPSPLANGTNENELKNQSNVVGLSQEYTCIYCGNKTSSWWYHQGGTDTCKCRDCLQQGKNDGI